MEELTDGPTTNNYARNADPPPVLNVDLHVLPDFTGRVVLHIENGRVICDRRLLDDEHICSVQSFIELAREAGLRIEEVAGGTDSNSNT
ncbi:hypothetical protein EMD38_05685 [Citrobacter freundii]